VRGKQKQLKQLIPAEDVIRTIEEASAVVADSVRSEGERKAEAINSFANRMLGEEMEKASKQIDKERARARFQAGRVVAQKKATKVAKKIVREIGDAVQVLAQRHGSQQSFADVIAASHNADAARPRITAEAKARVKAQLQQRARDQLRRATSAALNQ
jgi:hypothetical protein